MDKDNSSNKLNKNENRQNLNFLQKGCMYKAILQENYWQPHTRSTLSCITQKP